ncbi:polysaccharide deacetylase family protein [Azospirillum oryzae]|uniref:Chitooligosaccharide deacetylase n=2 Tax=Azospirillum oryzae TaxID=286727 RepID=A0A6N1AX64_9PROT|nr:polysaccharide deacetylase family protein [Azospirillum oryzae]QKS52452.1 polysaccharide deacetylase family protein [Azospirillum oryzae]
MLRISWPNAASHSSSHRMADSLRGRGLALVLPACGQGSRGLLKAALLACAIALPALSSHAAESPAKRQHAAKVEQKAPAPAAAPVAAAAPAAADGPVLQLGIFSRDGDAWWSWKNLQRREHDLTAGMTASVMLLDGKSEAGGVALYAQVAKGTDARALCRRIVGAGFGCLVVDRPAPAATPAPVTLAPVTLAKTTPEKAAPEKSATAPVPDVAPVQAATPAEPAFVPSPATKPPAVTVAVAPPLPDGKPPQPAVEREPVTATTTSVLAPIGSAVAAPLPPPSVAAALPPADGLVIYNEEDARTMADIEQHSRRKGRLRSVMPDSRYDVMPATLKRENWNLCALTFDDGPHRTVTRQVLDILNREGVRATYFPVGRIAERQGDLIRDFVAGGHEIGNHSLTHSDLRKMDAAGARYEIAETNRILREFGANPVLFRPPYGRYSDDLLTIAREEHMGSVLWSVDTRDWQVRNADKIVSQIKLGGLPGNVFLMHSTYASTAQALPRVIAELRAKGCEFVTLSEWLERARVLALPKIVNAGIPSPVAGTPTDRQ